MTKSRLLVSLMVIAMAAALIGGATMAWFTDSDEADPVTMTAGTLLISINDLELEGITEEISLENLNPGDIKKGSFVVKNDGTKNLQFIGYLCWQDIIGQLNDDLDEGMRYILKEKGYGDGKLSEVLNFKISVRDATWNYFELGEGVFYDGTLPSEGTPPLEFGLAELAPGESLTYDVEITFPEEADNDYQGSKINLAFGVVAGQTTNDAPLPNLDGIECFFKDNEGGGNEPDYSQYTGTVWTSNSGSSNSNNIKLTQNRVQIRDAKDENDELINGSYTIKLFINEIPSATYGPISANFTDGYSEEFSIVNWEIYNPNSIKVSWPSSLRVEYISIAE